MGEMENRAMVEGLWLALEKQDWDAATEAFHEDAVQEWPQSGERLVGGDTIMTVNRNYPGYPMITRGRTWAAGDLVVSTATLDYEGRLYHGVSIFEIEDGKIRRETDYFAEPFEAPEWRAGWVERM